MLEEYKCEDAEAVVLLMGSACGDVRQAIDAMRDQGKKVGMVKLRVFRPLPHHLLRSTLAKFKTVAVMDRADSVNSFVGPLYNEVAASLYDADTRPNLLSYVFGLGGKEFSPDDATGILEQALTGKKDETVTYVGVR